MSSCSCIKFTLVTWNIIPFLCGICATYMFECKEHPYLCMRLQSGGGEGHYEDIVAVEPPYDDLVTMSTSFQDPNVTI